MSRLTFYSTNGQAARVDLKGALLGGQAPDRGLYMPEAIPRLSGELWGELARMSYAELALEILWPFCRDVIDRNRLTALCADAYNFDVPLEQVTDRVHVMRLDQGPTGSFKDFAARLMARLMGEFVQEEGRRLTILTATSGDTGSAVASAFHGVDNIQVLVLFPIGEVSERQRKQMTTLGGNIRTLALDGKFDDCQAMVKQAFSDPDFAGLNLSSANSINIGRLLPQAVYYFYAHSRLAASVDEPIVISTPSGNFGNMMGAVLGKRMGLPVERLVVPVNANDEFPRFLETGRYQKIEPSRNCVSNAMNVGHPSNLARLVDVYGGWLDERGRVHRAPEFAAMRRDLFSTAVDDERTRRTIQQAWRDHQLLLEPHGAVGWRGFLDYVESKGRPEGAAVVLETAHPAKFPEEIERLLGFSPEAPESIARLEDLPEDYDRIEVGYEAFKDYLKRWY